MLLGSTTPAQGLSLMLVILQFSAFNVFFTEYQHLLGKLATGSLDMMSLQSALTLERAHRVNQKQKKCIQQRIAKDLYHKVPKLQGQNFCGKGHSG